MSYGLMVYSVPFGALKQYIGSKDAKALQNLEERLKERFIELDQLFGDSEKESTREALSHLVHGTLHPHLGGKYGYLVRSLCEMVGSFLDNKSFMPCRAAWLDQIQEAIQEMGTDPTLFRFTDLYLSGLPFNIPRANELPMCGHLTSEKVAAAYEELQRRRYKGGNDEVDEAIEDIREWLALATRREHGIIGFCY